MYYCAADLLPDRGLIGYIIGGNFPLGFPILAIIAATIAYLSPRADTERRGRAAYIYMSGWGMGYWALRGLSEHAKSGGAE